MSIASKVVGCIAFAALIVAVDAAAATLAKRTVCTITVNSPDEQAAFRRYLPKEEYQFVELVERGRPDWLASACRKDVRCDVLVISGHFNGHDFFSDQLAVDEFLPVQEMERVSCSDSCPGLFSQLKEVYMFGCTTLSPEAAARDVGELVRSLERSGHPHGEAEHLARQMLDGHGETNRDVMRRIFQNVPTIYGFSAVAPLGAAAAPLLARYFESGGRRSVGSGRADSRLLKYFSAHNLAVASGATGTASQLAHRRDVCAFVDDRMQAAERLRFVHGLLKRDVAEARMYFDRIETFVNGLGERERAAPAVIDALAEIAADQDARERYVSFARDADRAGTRARMIRVAWQLGWLSAEQERAELTAMVRDLLAGPPVSTTDIALLCRVNARGDLDRELSHLKTAPGPARRLDHAAVFACLRSPDDHAAVLAALASPRAEDVAIAEVYLHQRPITDPAELRGVVASIARMPPSDSQVRALDVLARHDLSDAASVDELMRLFARSPSVHVQRAIAGVLVRADQSVLDGTQVARIVRERRLSAVGTDDMIDILARRLAETAVTAEASLPAPSLGSVAVPWTRVQPTAFERP